MRDREEKKEMRKTEVEKRIAEIREDENRTGVFINEFLFVFDDWRIDCDTNYVYINRRMYGRHVGFCINYEQIFSIA